MRNNATATIERLELKEAGSIVKVWKEKGNVSGILMPLSGEMEKIAVEQGVIGKAFSFYTKEDADIQETDRATINEVVYEVKGVKKYDVGSVLDHLTILLEERKK